MKKAIILFFTLWFTISLSAQTVRDIIDAVNVFPEGSIRETTDIATPKYIKTDIRFVPLENQSKQRVGWYEFKVSSEKGEQEGFYRVDIEDLGTMIQVLAWMKDIVNSGDYRGDVVSAMTKNGWIIWLPKGFGEDVHVSKVFETPYNSKVFHTSVLVNDFCLNPNVGVIDYLQSLIDSYDNWLQKPVRRNKK